MRKLDPEGPLVGPARLVAAATGGVPAGFAAGIAAALRLRQPGDRQARALTRLRAPDRARSSAGQSSRLIIGQTLVRIHPGPLGLRAALHERDALPLVLEAECAPAALLALVLGRRRRWRVHDHDVPADHRSFVE